MKTKNGKCGLFAALTAALLVTAALIISCPAPTEAPDGYKPPAGMGYLTVNIPEFSGERTILPSAPSSWDSYDLTIQQYSALSGGTSAGYTPISKTGVTNLSTPISLAPGYYTLAITASTSGGEAAYGITPLRFQILPGAGTTVTVPIKPLSYAEDDDGEFEFIIQAADGVTVASYEMTIKALVAGDAITYDGLSPISPTPVEGVTRTILLTPGAYSVFLKATVGTETASITEIVNIHQNLKSSVSFGFDGTSFTSYISLINLDFTADDPKPVLAKTTAPTTVADGGSFNVLNGTPETISITNVTAAGYTSVAWYCDSIATPIGTTNSLTITAGSGIFTKSVTYRITAVGITANGAYSTNFKVNIGSF